MPIPPRPIPVHHPRHPHHSRQTRPKPGSSVPRKSGITSSSLEWRAEIALLNELGPKSVPLPLHLSGNGNGNSKGVKMVNKKDNESEKDVKEGEMVGRREVGLRELIDDGRGKREKRATTATTLGFDFIPNPTILTLPDIDADSSFNKKKSSSLLTISKSSPIGPSSTPLENTPLTPGLLPQPSSSPEPEPGPELEDEDQEDDWEYIPSLSSQRNVVDNEDDHDIIILGELELEDDGDLKGCNSKMGTKDNGIKNLSYADILGN
ncbi:hypothetical protein L486_00848 [Kwoniella mangroviensis CBS 10435]|uniref:Uncharacterized protein n=1 Tax=Kwoniella mangroviensis CBS 10435 TaxID=1331196 RepID=A0A1B9J0B7_9TREE|nr:hypothetical protein L486_00848 [Kwoniella mangroviensis CBS 10435]